MTEEQRLLYRVEGRYMNGSRMSLCATSGRALQRLNAYRNGRYADVALFGPDGALTEGDLRRLIVENGRKLHESAALSIEDDEMPATA